MEEISNKIKSFIYLDENKMFSISSQLFEGITKYILQEDSASFEEQNEQKGHFLSGRFMADIMFQRTVKSEMKYLHDFAFNLFEKELLTRNMLYEVTSDDTIDTLKDKRIVKVTGKLVFNDYSKLRDTIEHFNELGRAFGELQQPALTEEIHKVEITSNQTKDREKKNKQKQAVNLAKRKIDDYLKEIGLLVDEKCTKNLSTIMQYGYHENYEIKLAIENSELFCTAAPNCTFLKEPKEVLISKYSRMTEMTFSCIGIITQIGNAKAVIPHPIDKDMKNATQEFTAQIANLEEQFNGRSSNEFVVDPIAIFTEL